MTVINENHYKGKEMNEFTSQERKDGFCFFLFYFRQLSFQFLDFRYFILELSQQSYSPTFTSLSNSSFFTTGSRVFLLYEPPQLGSLSWFMEDIVSLTVICLRHIT